MCTSRGVHELQPVIFVVFPQEPQTSGYSLRLLQEVLTTKISGCSSCSALPGSSSTASGRSPACCLPSTHAAASISCIRNACWLAERNPGARLMIVRLCGHHLSSPPHLLPARCTLVPTGPAPPHRGPGQPRGAELCVLRCPQRPHRRLQAAPGRQLPWRVHCGQPGAVLCSPAWQGGVGHAGMADAANNAICAYSRALIPAKALTIQHGRDHCVRLRTLRRLNLHPGPMTVKQNFTSSAIAALCTG